MMVTLRMFEEMDYPIVADWWKQRGWPPVPHHALSQFGMVAENGDRMVAAGWLYLTTSSMAWIEWFVTNPDAPLRDRAIGLECLLERLVAEAKLFGATCIFSSLASRSLVKLYKKQGFIVGDEGMTNVLLRFGGDECLSEPAPPSSAVP